MLSFGDLYLPVLWLKINMKSSAGLIRLYKVLDDSIDGLLLANISVPKILGLILKVMLFKPVCWSV